MQKFIFALVAVVIISPFSASASHDSWYGSQPQQYQYYQQPQQYQYYQPYMQQSPMWQPSVNQYSMPMNYTYIAPVQYAYANTSVQPYIQPQTNYGYSSYPSYSAMPYSYYPQQQYGYYNQPAPYSYGIPTGDTVPIIGGDMCYFPDYSGGRAACGSNPNQWIYDPWTGTWY